MAKPFNKLCARYSGGFGKPRLYCALPEGHSGECVFSREKSCMFKEVK